MSAQIVKLGLLSLISSALAAPIASPEQNFPRHGKWSHPAASNEAVATPTVQNTVAQPTAATVANTPAAEAPAYTPSSAGTSASPVASSSAGSYSSGGAKGGVAYTQASAISPFVGGANIGWCYNWNANPGSVPSGIEYVPVLWGTQSVYTSSWVSDANAAIGKGATAVVGFNEPDHAQQANLDANTAASAYKQYITDNFSGKVKLVAPSVTNGAAPMGLGYLSNFMSACADCDIQAINLHWYDSSSNIDYFKSYIQGAYEQFKLPIWLTEFGTTDGNDDAFLQQALPWLESQSYVERYAYFMAEEGKLLSGSSLSAAGKTYAGA